MTQQEQMFNHMIEQGIDESEARAHVRRMRLFDEWSKDEIVAEYADLTAIAATYTELSASEQRSMVEWGIRGLVDHARLARRNRPYGTLKLAA